MRRQNLGALIVTCVVVLGLIVAVFIVPWIESPTVEARATLDQAAERAARRLTVLERMADTAVAADRQALTLPEAIRKPDVEAMQRTIAQKPAMINEAVAELQTTFRNRLAESDARYEKLTGDKPSNDKYAERIDVPVGETAQISWVRQSMDKAGDPAAMMLKQIEAAISDLQQTISSISLQDYRGADHFRANWLLGGLQYQKAALLGNLAANRRAKADRIRAQLTDDYRWYASADVQAKGIAARLEAVSLVPVATPAPAAPARVTPPPSAMEAAVDAAGPAAVTPDASAAAAPAPEGQPAGDGLLSKVGSLLRSAAAKPAGTDQAAQAAAPAPAAQAPTAAPTGDQAPAALPATEDPSVLAARYEQEVAEQIVAAEKTVADLQQEIASPQQKLEQASAELKQLQQKLNQVEQAGYDVTSMDSFEAYKKSYTDVQTQMRTVEATIQSLQDGTMAGAQVDPDGSDDLTTAKYTGGQPQVGLTVLNRRLAGAQKTLELLKEAQKEMQTLRASLQQQKASQDKALVEAQTKAKQQAEQLAKTYADLDAVLAEASAKEDAALSECQAAIRSYTTARQAAKKMTSDASNELSLAAPAPDKPNTRLEQMRDYTQPEAAAEQGLYNGYMLTAQIQLQRAVNLRGYRNLLASVQAAGVQTKLAEVEQAIEESLNAAISAADAAEGESDALAHAETYGRLVSTSKDKERCTWLGPAMQGLAYDLLSQAQAAKGQPQQAAEARAKAVELLAEATKGNENSELLLPYTQLLASLKKGQP